MDDIIEVLRKRNIIEILLELRRIEGPIDKNTLNYRIVGDRQPRQSIYDGCNDLENIKLIDVDKKSKPNKHFVTFTEKGAVLARKLSYVFDSEKEVYPISKERVAQLNDYAKLEGVTWQELMNQAIPELLSKLKEKHPLKVGKT